MELNLKKFSQKRKKIFSSSSILIASTMNLILVIFLISIPFSIFSLPTNLEFNDSFTEFPVRFDDTCYNEKLEKLFDKNVNHPRIFDLARELCTYNLDKDLTVYFDNISKFATSPMSEKYPVNSDCIKYNLLKLNAKGPLVETFNKNLIYTFKPDGRCEKYFEDLYDDPMKDECTRVSPQWLFYGNLRAAVLAIDGNYGEEIIKAERKNFIFETKFQWEFILNCLIELENIKTSKKK